MCLALPMRITAVDGALATIATAGLEQRASLMLVPDAKVGDYVLVHAGFAISVLDVCRRVRAATGLAAVAMAGGVFQNRLLADACEALLSADGFEALAAGLIPVNDGGVALGQAVVAGYTSLQRRGELG